MSKWNRMGESTKKYIKWGLRDLVFRYGYYSRQVSSGLQEGEIENVGRKLFKALITR